MRYTLCVKIKNILILFSLCFLFNLFLWGFIYLNSHRKLTVVFLDVGQGDAIYIETPNGRQVLIDGGADRKVVSQLGNIMPFADKSLDVVLATHPDADHIGGLPYVFDSYKIGAFVDNGASSDTQTYSTLQRKVAEENSLKVRSSRGMKIILDEKENITLQVLSPYMNTSNLSDTNTGSIVAKLSYGSSTFMLTGDAPQDVENYLVAKDGENLKSTVLKVGHHGSRTSSGEDFLKMVSPEFAVVSTGKNNRYGHPHQEVLDILNKLHIAILRTDTDGTIICKGDERSVLCK